MAGISETRQWTEDVYQLEESDFVMGGAEGVDNLPHRHLANRTRWLRDKILSGTQTVVMRDDDGDLHHMVWIPRFTLQADAIAQGVPSQDLKLGGFLVDKYHCIGLEYVGGITKAVSSPLRQPLTNVEFLDAREMATRRTFGGRACHLMTPREWGHLAWIMRLLGHDIRGNLASGRDPREPDAWESFGEPGYGAPAFGGTGPNSWFHNGLSNGVYGLLGNVWHLLDPGEYVAGCLRVEHSAKLVNNITDTDPSFEIEDPAGYYDPKDAFQNWPATNGLVWIDFEWVVYGELVPDPNDPSRATLTNCSRGAFGSDAAAHYAGDPCDNRLYHCLIPGGYAAQLDDDGLNNTDPGQVTFAWTFGPLEHGTRDAAPSAGDVICCGNEDLLIDAVNGNQITATRGYNGTTISAHPNGMFFAKYSPNLVRTAQGYQTGYATGDYRTHPDLEELFLPATTQTTQPTGDVPVVKLEIRTAPPLPITRGSSYTAAQPSNMLDLMVPSTDDPTVSTVGFRCAYRPADYQYGGNQ